MKNMSRISHCGFGGLVGLLFAVAISSCSVKEDRTPCPCFLNVSFQDREHITSRVGMVGYRETEVFREGIMVEEYDPYWVKAIHKGLLDFAAWKGVSRSKDNGHYVTIDLGNQCDSLYAFHDVVDATGEMAYTDVLFHKQFCTVHLDIMKRPAELQGYHFLVEGNTCGFDMFDFSPVSGAFCYDAVATPGARIVDFRIPRQSDDSMMVTIDYHYGDGKVEAIAELPLGEYIRATGYNWSTEDLQDIYIMIDLVVGRLVISVDGWEDGVTFNFIEQ